MLKLPFGTDAWGNVQTFHYDETTDDFMITTEQDAEPILELNRAVQNEDTGKFKDGLHHVARIPLVVYQELVDKGIDKDPVALKRWLNDPDNRYFRTKLGVV